jgi:hypothetical protein
LRNRGKKRKFENEKKGGVKKREEEI